MKLWFNRSGRVVAQHLTISTGHTWSADACANSALISLFSSWTSDLSFDPPSSSVPRGSASCSAPDGSFLDSLTELAAGATFHFFLFGPRFAEEGQSCSASKGSDSSVSLQF